MERDVTLLEMLEAREDRARRLEALRTRHGSAAVSFTDHSPLNSYSVNSPQASSWQEAAMGLSFFRHPRADTVSLPSCSVSRVRILSDSL